MRRLLKLLLAGDGPRKGSLQIAEDLMRQYSLIVEVCLGHLLASKLLQNHCRVCPTILAHLICQVLRLHGQHAGVANARLPA